MCYGGTSSFSVIYYDVRWNTQVGAEVREEEEGGCGTEDRRTRSRKGRKKGELKE